MKNEIILTNNKKNPLHQVSPIRKPSDFHQYFHRSRKIRKAGSSKLYDITTFQKIVFFFKRISISTQT